MSRLAIPHTAFALSHGKKRPRDETPDHLAFIRQLPCCVCGHREHTEAAHIRMGCIKYGKPHSGTGQKPSDAWAVPLCANCHRLGPRAQHTMGEAVFWAFHGVDPFVLALALWQATGDESAGVTIIAELKK